MTIWQKKYYFALVVIVIQQGIMFAQINNIGNFDKNYTTANPKMTSQTTSDGIHPKLNKTASDKPPKDGDRVGLFRQVYQREYINGVLQ